jgi:hypothetical protein
LLRLLNVDGAWKNDDEDDMECVLYISHMIDLKMNATQSQCEGKDEMTETNAKVERLERCSAITEGGKHASTRWDE